MAAHDMDAESQRDEHYRIHASKCEKPIAECRTCSDIFELKPYPEPR